MLSFTGIGDAFNTELGNNSAYIRIKDSMLLIDCGGTTFRKMKKEGILSKLKNVHVLITNTYSDHVGSIGELIFYCNNVLKIKPLICYPSRRIMENFLHTIGVQSSLYEMNSNRNIIFEDENFGKVEIYFNSGNNVSHMLSYNILLNIMKEKIYFSGASNHLSEEIITKAKNNEITRIYQDTCASNGEISNHLSFVKLCKVIKSKELRKKIYCMHLDEGIKIDEIIKEGFNIPTLLI